jgi:membrane protease YdiL (CAAX protease family)
MVGSLVVLAWPPLRGVPWRQVREDVGLTPGRQPLAELFAGVGSYLCALPLLAAALVMTWGLSLLQKTLTGRDPTQLGEGPSHPVGGVALTRDPWMWVAVVLLAVVLAPIVEEIMFRGLLYRHLREASWRWGTFLSVAAATLASGFVFAIIHPQGLLGVPVLMALASSFAITREWRGSLVGPMVAHGINNGVATLFLFIMAG